MTHVDFYILGDALASTRIEFTCRLVEKASSGTEKVLVYSSDRRTLEILDERLWDFRPMSFIAHRLLPESHLSSNEDSDPVLLTSSDHIAAPETYRNVLINLDEQVPLFFSRFGRTMEVVNKEPSVQSTGRERYRFYKQRGYPLKHHNISPSVA